MTKRHLIAKIDNVLGEYQFHRSDLFWNRSYADYVNVIDLQISKSKAIFTVNVGVAEKFVLSACWGVGNSDRMEEPLCTVRACLGELLHGRDVWWSLSDDDSIQEVLSGIKDAAIPFLQLNHSVDQMIKSLENDPAGKRYPPGVIYLALLHYRKGENDRCREMFKSMKLAGAWIQKASNILDALN